MSDSGPGGRRRGRRRRVRGDFADVGTTLSPAGPRALASTTLVLYLLSAATLGGEPLAPWEIEGYSQAPAWGGVEDYSGIPRSADAPPAWNDPNRSPPSTGAWSGRDRAPAPESTRGWSYPSGQDGRALDGEGAYPRYPFSPDAYGASQPGEGRYGEDPGYRSRSESAPAQASPPRPTSDWGAGDLPAGAYPGYRFRGDPESDETAQSDGIGYRFRPLSPNELGRWKHDSGWRPIEPFAGSRRAEPREQAPERSDGTGPAYGYAPNPWQSH